MKWNENIQTLCLLILKWCFIILLHTRLLNQSYISWFQWTQVYSCEMILVPIIIIYISLSETMGWHLTLNDLLWPSTVLMSTPDHDVCLYQAESLEYVIFGWLKYSITGLTCAYVVYSKSIKSNGDNFISCKLQHVVWKLSKWYGRGPGVPVSALSKSLSQICIQASASVKDITTDMTQHCTSCI